MSDSKHTCPRCGASLPTRTVQIPVYTNNAFTDFTSDHVVNEDIISHYNEVEEVADCFRCTGSY